MGNPYFDSASQNIDQSKLASLQAVAAAGTAGKQAYQQAQDSINADKQAAMARAATRATTLGVGGNDQTFGGAYDARLGQLATNRAGFEGGLAQTQASSDSYLEKARAGLPLLQAINTNKATAQEAAIKSALALAKEKAAAQAAKDAAAEARAERAAERADARSQKSSDRADARAAKTAAAKDPSFDKLIAAGKLEVAASPLNKARLDTGNILDTVTQNPDVRMARLAGRDMGYSPLQIGTALSQGKTNTYTKAAAPVATPDERWLISNVRGMDQTKARQALAAPEMGWARDFVNDTLSAVQVDETGAITSAPKGFEGMVGQTPAAAFEAWVRAQKGNLTMKEGLSKYYGPAIAAMFGK